MSANPTIVALCLLLVVSGVAAHTTVGVADAAALAATAAFNFFFLPPTGTWAIADLQNWLALFTFLVASVLISRLSAQARFRARDAVARRDELARLFDVTRDILLTDGVPDPLAAIAEHVVRRFRFPCVSILRRTEEGVWIEHTTTAAMDLAERDLAAMLPSPAGSPGVSLRTSTGAGDAVWLVPLRAGDKRVGVLALQDAAIDSGTRDAIAGIVAIAIERQHLLDERRQADLARRGAELKSALLSSLSHDLRTPLTALAVAAGNLDAGGLSAPARQEQVDVIRGEVARLNRLFEHVVQMARIETRAITPEPQWVQPAELVETARQQLGRVLDGHPVTVDVDERVAVRLDPRLTSAALAHVIENAAQYSPPKSPIDVRGWIEQDELRLRVRDHGGGIPEAEQARIFDRFYRGAAGQHRFGTGMGLAIARGLLDAQGGRVWAENDPEGGARVTLAVPITTRLVTEPVEAVEP
jgi:two-component system sensor histidine kinase KdpD